jgi:hypothetical protein
MSRMLQYRRLENGVVDVDFYRRRATALRRVAVQEAFSGNLRIKMTVSCLVVSLAVATMLTAPGATGQTRRAQGQTVISTGELTSSPGKPIVYRRIAAHNSPPLALSGGEP